ncbi:MAG: TonB-dependent receptor plug domain-containing protein, partial [Gemmatimonadales bacterium]
MKQPNVRNAFRIALALIFCAPLIVGAQGTAAVSGGVTERGSTTPLQGAQVTIPGTQLGASANADGTFTIRGVASGSVKVRAQMIGYEPIVQTVQVPASGVVTVSFAMTRTATTLTGVVVTATGEERRRSIGTAMATIDTAQITRSAAVNTQDILAGSTPGVTVLSNSGQPGVGGTIQLRGVNSVSQGNSPLVYIDGVRVFNGHTPTNVGGRQFISPLNDIPAEDIDHIEIVKGPAATTLYGTEASGGVLQIFTK